MLCSTVSGTGLRVDLGSKHRAGRVLGRRRTTRLHDTAQGRRRRAGFGGGCASTWLSNSGRWSAAHRRATRSDTVAHGERIVARRNRRAFRVGDLRLVERHLPRAVFPERNILRHDTTQRRGEGRAGPLPSHIPAETSTTITYHKYCNANT